MSSERDNGNGSPMVEPGLDICPHTLGKLGGPSSCIGTDCHLWLKFELHRPEGVEVIEDCTYNLQARFAFHQMGTLMQIQAAAGDQNRIQPVGAHPRFRGK